MGCLRTTKIACTLCGERFVVASLKDAATWTSGLTERDMKNARCAAGGGHRLCPPCLEYNRKALDAVREGLAYACVLRVAHRHTTAQKQAK